MLIATKYIAIECRADDSASQCTDIFDRILIFDEVATVAFVMYALSYSYKLISTYC